jgi:tetratricopeptide (TPR) repeat protein
MKRNRQKPAPQQQPQHWLRRLWQSPAGVPLLLAIVVIVTFADTLGGGFVLDNGPIIINDPRIHEVSLENLKLILTQNYWWPTYESDLYRPLTTFSFLFNYSLLESAAQPLQYHILNMILHWANAWLVYLLAARYLVHRSAALIVALVFAVHPLVIEAVTNIIGRADLFAALFMLAALELHARLRAGSIMLRLRARFGLGLFALLAVLSKESGAVLIALMLLDDLSQRPAAAFAGRLAAARAWLRAVPWSNYACVVPSIVVLAVARYELLKNSPVTYQLATDNPMALAGFWTREMTAVKVLGYYLKLTFWPAALSCDYSYNQIPIFGWTASGADLDAWLGLAAVVALAVAALVAWRRLPAVFFFLGFAFITLLPMSNLVITIGTVMGERFMYLPLVGLAGALAAVIEWFAARVSLAPVAASPRGRRIATGLAAVVIVALAARTIVRNLDWHDNTRLWRSAVQVCPNSFKVYKGLATSLARNPAELDECIRLAQHAIEVLDTSPVPLEHSPGGLYCDLARYEIAKGDRIAQAGSDAKTAAAWYGKAEQILQRAIRGDRAVNAAARRGSLERGVPPDEYHDVGMIDIYGLQARLCLRQKRYAEALEACRWEIHLKPAMGPTYMLWADISAATGELDDAAVHLIQATILPQKEPLAWSLLERIYAVLRPGDRAVIRGPNGVSLNEGIPLVRQQVNRACHDLVENLLEGNYRQDAEDLRKTAIEKYGCPPAVFADLFDQPAKSH